jgi:hypothetical protein
MTTHLNENEIKEDNESQYSSDSDEDFDYFGVECYKLNINRSALDVMRDLSRKLNKSHYIQSSINDKIDPKLDHLVINYDIQYSTNSPFDEFTDSQNNSIFESKLKLLKDLELNYKRKSIYNNIDENEDQINEILTKSDVQINEIPNSFQEFLKILFQLNASLIEDINSKLYFKSETNYRSAQFKDHDSYVKAFIPFVFRELWESLKYWRKRQLRTDLMDFQIVNENQIKCSLIRNINANESQFKFGQIVVLNYLIDLNLNANDSEPKVFFGVVQSIDSKLIDKTSHHFVNSPELQSEENDFILDEITVFCNPIALNYNKVSVMTLNCVQKYLLEARVVYELKEKFPFICEQILKPIHTFGVSGVSINMTNRKQFTYFDDQLDSIQKAYEVCCASDLVSSSFVAIYGPKNTGKTECLRETILQLFKYGERNVNKLLVVSKSVSEITSIVEQLKRHKIKVYHIDSEGKSISHNNKEIGEKVEKLQKELLFQDIIGNDTHSYEECMKLYKEEIQLKDISVKAKFMKEQIEKLVICRLITESQVIIGSIDSICNDETFNFTYNFVDQNIILSALIDNASIYTEPEILTLLYAGVKGFVLIGDTFESPKIRQKVKTESFLQRYIRLYNNCNSNDLKSNNTSVVRLYDSIDSRLRYAQNLKNRENRLKNNYFVKNKAFTKTNNNYRRNNSRFCNNGFNKFAANKKTNFNNYNTKDRKLPFNRYHDRKPFPRFHTSNIDHKNPKPVVNNPNEVPFLSSVNNESDYQNNDLMNDIMPNASHFAYGNRESYRSQTFNSTNDYDYNQINYNMMSTPVYSNIIPLFVPETKFQFMANPTQNNNQNYPLG